MVRWAKASKAVHDVNTACRDERGRLVTIGGVSDNRRWLFATLTLATRLGVVPPAIPDLDGRNVDVLAGAGTKATVLVFVGVDCPISNRYAPELERLEREFSPRGIASSWSTPSLHSTPKRRAATAPTTASPSRRCSTASTGWWSTPASR